MADSSKDLYGHDTMVEDADTLARSIDKMLSFLLRNTAYNRSMLYMEDILTNEKYILFFYIKAFAERGVNYVSRDSLELALTENASHWISSTSIYSASSATKLVSTVPVEYIASTYTEVFGGEAPNSAGAYARALTMLVLRRYDIIMALPAAQSADELKDTIEGFKIMAVRPVATTIMNKAFHLLSDQGFRPMYLGRTKYTEASILEFLRDSVNEAIARFNSETLMESEDDRVNSVMQMLSGKTTYADPVFHWNLGTNFLPSLLFGWVLFLSAPPKEGKTRFTLGEMVYPALCERRNVTYMSGEMDESAIFATLVVKHLYASKGINLGSEKKFSKVINIIIMSSKIAYKTISRREREIFDKYPRAEVELVLTAFRDLFLSGNYGNLNIVSANANSEGGSSKSSHKFIIENLEADLLKDLQAQKPGKQCDLLVIDHAGHFVSNSGLNDVQIFRQVYQTGVRVAKNKVHPIGVVIINHTNTKQGESIKSMADLEEGPMKAFGSSEAGKSADIDISLASTEDQKKDGIVSLVVNYLRWSNIIETYKSRVFPLIANRGTCEYTLQSKTKSPYKRREVDDDTKLS